MATGTLQNVFGLLVFITVALVAFAIGVLVSLDNLKSAVRRPRFLGLLILNVVVVPVVGTLVVLTLPLSEGIETGFILCAVCAGGPLGLKVSQLCGADLPWTLSLIVTLLLLNVAALPLWSMAFFSRSLTMRLADLFGVLVLAILVPLLIGAWVGRRLPGRSRDWSDRATTASNTTLVLAVATGVLANAEELVHTLSAWGVLAALWIVFVSGLFGWLVPKAPNRRRSGALVTLNRATSVALLVVGRAYVDDAEVFTAVVLFGVIQTTVAVGISFYWRFAGQKLDASVAASVSGVD